MTDSYKIFAYARQELQKIMLVEHKAGLDGVHTVEDMHTWPHTHCTGMQTTKETQALETQRVGRYCFADLPFDEYGDVGSWGTTVPRAKIVRKGMGPRVTVQGGRKFGTI